MTIEHQETWEQSELLWFLQRHLTVAEITRMGDFGAPADCAPNDTVLKLLPLTEERKAFLATALAVERRATPHPARKDSAQIGSAPGVPGAHPGATPILTRAHIAAHVRRRLPAGFPLALRFRGNPTVLSLPKVAIIGSRHPTYYGRTQAHRFARALAEAGLCILSGGAIGIDAIANGRGFQHGATCAIIGSGIARPYPLSNAALIDAIGRAPRGLVLSEFDDTAGARPHHFPRRNQTIAAIADFVLVVEAALKSGTRITALAALDAGRDVGALPGPVESPLSQGTHELLKLGAYCIERPEDVLERIAALRVTRDGILF